MKTQTRGAEMRIAIYCLDKPRHEALRLENRAAHLAYVGGFGAAVRFGGPLLDGTGTHMQGSLLICEFASMEDAKAFCANDPYARAGLFDSVSVHPVKEVFGGLKDPS